MAIADPPVRRSFSFLCTPCCRREAHGAPARCRWPARLCVLLKGWAGKGSEFMRTFLASLVAVVSLGAVVMPTAVSAQTNDPVRIGLEAPLTGDQKSIGIGMLDGAKLAASQM